MSNGVYTGSYIFSGVRLGQRTIYIRTIAMTQPDKASAQDMTELRAIEQSVHYS